MFRYINNDGWMTGVTGRCEQKCNRLKLILEGQDDPNYDPNSQAKPKPLEALAAVLNEGFQNAELGDYWTTTESYNDDDDRINIVITIVIADDAQATIADAVCDNVLAYLNKPGILDNSSHTCTFVESCTDKVLLHLLGDY